MAQQQDTPRDQDMASAGDTTLDDTGETPARRPLIVAAAILDGSESRFFAARRTYPPTLAGLWEFPGGKVEDSEDCHTALSRECREELGVEIAVGGEVLPEGKQPGEFAGWPLANGLRMRVFEAAIADSAPSTGEPHVLRLTEAHDEGAWLPLSEEALETEWIPADEPIVRALLRRRVPAR